jgi:nucleoid-associated protein YgaU
MPSGRFSGQPVTEVLAPDGTTRRVVQLGLGGGQAVTGTALHRVVLGDAIDAIARHYLGDESLWWTVLDVNPVRYPFDLVPGELLQLPEPGLSTRANRARSF